MKKFIYILAIAATLCGCFKESDLKKSIFIPDPDDSRLPAYTEWGYNTFGAYFDRDIFIYTDNTTPFKLIAYSSSSEFRFIGKMHDEFWDRYDNEEQISLIFKTTSILPKKAEDLTAQNGKTFQLNTSSFEVFIEKNGIRTKLLNLQGTLTFQRVQKVFVDKKYTEMILSGYFDLNGMFNNSPISISEGRFDVAVKDSYSFYYQP